MISQNPDDSGWFRMISCLIIRPPRMILQKISGHFCQFWNPRARMMASNFRRNFVKLWPAVYPPRMAPFDLKLWENAFQTIPDISFFDVEKKNWRVFSIKSFIQKKFRRKIDKLPFFAELWIFGRNRQMRLEKLPPKFWFSTLYDFWRRGKRDSFNFCRRLSAKKDFNPFRFSARRHNVMCPGCQNSWNSLNST